MTAFDPDAVAATVAAAQRAMFAAEPKPGMWCDSEGGVLGAVSGLPVAAFNFVLAERLDPDPAAVTRMLDRVERSGLPHQVHVRTRSGPVADLLSTRGLMPGDEIPVMALSVGELEETPWPSGLEIRVVSPAEAGTYAEAVAVGFGAPPGFFDELFTAEWLEAAPVRAYLGLVEGRVVSTAMGLRDGDSVAVFNISTLEAFQKRGYGAAVTRRTVGDGAADGATWSWLQSSPEGFGLYSGLGYRTVERWTVWTRVDPDLI